MLTVASVPGWRSGWLRGKVQAVLVAHPGLPGHNSWLMRWGKQLPPLPLEVLLATLPPTSLVPPRRACLPR